jgi:transcriptional regulator with XRE-family HTH domain
VIVVSNAHATPVSDRIAQRVVVLRESQKLTRAAVAEAMAAAGAIGSAASLRNFEDRRKREIGIDELVALAGALGCTPAELLDDVLDFGADDRGSVEPAALHFGKVGEAVRDDVEAFGDLVGVEPSLAQVSFVLAAAIDDPDADPKTLPPLVKELRQVLDAIKNGRQPSGGDDDDLGDLDRPD